MFCDHIQQMVCCLHKPNIKEPPNPPPRLIIYIYIYTVETVFQDTVLSGLIFLWSVLCVFSLRYF